MLRRSLLVLALSACAAGAVSPTAYAASVRPADPIDCTVSGYGSPGTYSFTYNITKNPCQLPSRAYAQCKIGSYVQGMAYGATSTSYYGGASKAYCGDQTVGHYGHEEYVAGSWQMYQMG